MGSVIWERGRSGCRVCGKDVYNILLGVCGKCWMGDIPDDTEPTGEVVTSRKENKIRTLLHRPALDHLPEADGREYHVEVVLANERQLAEVLERWERVRVAKIADKWVTATIATRNPAEVDVGKVVRALPATGPACGNTTRRHLPCRYRRPCPTHIPGVEREKCGAPTRSGTACSYPADMCLYHGKHEKVTFAGSVSVPGPIVSPETGDLTERTWEVPAETVEGWDDLEGLELIARVLADLGELGLPWDERIPPRLVRASLGRDRWTRGMYPQLRNLMSAIEDRERWKRWARKHIVPRLLAGEEVSSFLRDIEVTRARLS